LSVDDEEQALLKQAGISRYDRAGDIANLMASPVSAKAERILLLRREAFDYNCQQHTPLGSQRPR
jgi:hypothetical protein